VKCLAAVGRSDVENETAVHRHSFRKFQLWTGWDEIHDFILDDVALIDLVKLQKCLRAELTIQFCFQIIQKIHGNIIALGGQKHCLIQADELWQQAGFNELCDSIVVRTVRKISQIFDLAVPFLQREAGDLCRFGAFQCFKQPAGPLAQIAGAGTGLPFFLACRLILADICLKKLVWLDHLKVSSLCKYPVR